MKGDINFYKLHNLRKCSEKNLSLRREAPAISHAGGMPFPPPIGLEVHGVQELMPDSTRRMQSPGSSPGVRHRLKA
jgi:hypothetical protein